MATSEMSHKRFTPAAGPGSTIVDGLLWILPGAALAALGYFLGHFAGVGVGVGFLSFCIWTVIFVAPGIMIVSQRDFYVLERFGRFHSVKYHGIRWRNWIVDRVRHHNDFQTKEFPLYADGRATELDFKDGSAPVVAKAYFSIGNQEDIDAKRWSVVSQQVARWVYAYKDPYARVFAVFDGALRPRLQALTIDEAQESTEKVSQDAAADAEDTLIEIGCYPADVKPLVVEDIVIPEEIKELRLQKLRGEAQAQEEAAQLTGPLRAAQSYRKMAKESGEELPFSQAIAIVMQERAFDVVEGTGANISLFARDLQGIFTSFNITPKETPKP